MGSPNGAAAEPESGTGPGKVSATSEPATTNAANPPAATAAAVAGAAAASSSSAAAAAHLIKDPEHIHPSDQYCLRWTNHGSHVLNVFSQLLHDEALVDVTLAAEGQSLRAHKMVLSACSSFFRSLFATHPERYPIIILKDTRFDELKTLLEFMYKGEVNVEHGQLDTLLKTAENLRVKGLAEVYTDPATSRRPSDSFTYDRTNSVIVGRDAENAGTSRNQQEQIQQQVERRLPKPRPRYPFELPREKLRHLLRYRPYLSHSRSRRKKRHRQKSPRAFTDARYLGDDSHTRESSDYIDHVQPQQTSSTNIKPWPPDYEDSDRSDDETSDTSDVQEELYPRNPYWPPTVLPSTPYHPTDSRIALQHYRGGKELLQPMQHRSTYESGAYPVSSKHLRTSRSSSSSELYSESSQHSDQFSEDQMPAAEVLIEEGDFLNPAGDFSSERSFGATADTYRSRKRRRDQYSVEIFPSGPAAEGTSHRKRFIAFRTSDYQASDSPGSFAHTGREIPEELTISAVRRQGSERGGKLASNNSSAPCVSIIPAQYDVRRRPVGLPISRSATSSPRPAPSSARSFEGDEDGDGEQGTTSAAELGSRTPLLYRRPMSSVSLIESHVGVGFTLGSREKPYKCEQCGQCYKYLSAFTKHKEQNHTAKLPGDKPFRCDICGMQFKYLKSFKKHRLNHTVERLHPDQPQPYAAEGRSLLDSTDTRSENASPLTTCSLPPDKEEDELPPNVTIKEEVVRPSSAEESDEAGRDASDTGIAQGNLRLVSPSRLQQQVATCPNCHLRFINEESLKLHSVNCTESVMSSAVPVQPSGASTINSEDESAGPSGLQEILRQQLRLTHRRSDAPAADEAAGEGTSSSSRPSSVRNISSSQSKDSAISTNASSSNTAPVALPVPVPPAPPQDYDPSRPHLCQYCGKGFKAKENLKLHIRKHTGEKPFECEFCGRAFGGKSDMNRHLRIHTGERPYRCDACGKTFARADYLSKHLSTHMT